MKLSSFFQDDDPMRIGFAESKDYLCCAIDDRQGLGFMVDWLKKPQTNRQLLKYSKSITNESLIIRALPYRTIWRKVVYLPLSYSDQEIHKHVMTLIKQNVPLDIKKLVPDYIVERDEVRKAYCVQVYAAQRDMLKNAVIRRDNILDCELSCFMRGYHVMNPKASTNFTENVYHFRDIEFRLTPEKVVEFTPKAAAEPHHLTVNDLVFPENHEVLDKEAYVVAIGTVLWNGYQ